MDRLHGQVGALNAPIDQTQEVIHAAGVNFTINLLNRMIHNGGLEFYPSYEGKAHAIFEILPRQQHRMVMPRRPRNVFPGIAHHITQRGNNREQVFFSDGDYSAYVGLLMGHCSAMRVAVQAFCLMPNHIHLVAIPDDETGLSKALGRTHCEYAIAFNRAGGRSGHLWQNRFFSCPLDREHFRRAIAYTELNPVRAGLVREAWEWPWSSAHADWFRSGGGVMSGRLGFETTGECGGFAGDLSDDEADRIRRATRVGEPLGSKTFVMDLERKAGRVLVVRERGRPAKPKAEGVAGVVRMI